MRHVTPDGPPVADGGIAYHAGGFRQRGCTRLERRRGGQLRVRGERADHDLPGFLADSAHPVDAADIDER